MSFKMKGFPMIKGTSPVKKTDSSPLNQMVTTTPEGGAGGSGYSWHQPNSGYNYNYDNITKSVVGGGKVKETKSDSNGDWLETAVDVASWIPIPLVAGPARAYKAYKILKKAKKLYDATKPVRKTVVKGLKKTKKILTSPTAKKIYVATAIAAATKEGLELATESKQANTSVDVKKATSNPSVEWKNTEDFYRNRTGGDINIDFGQEINKIRMNAYGTITPSPEQHKKLRATIPKYDKLMSGLNSWLMRAIKDSTVSHNASTEYKGKADLSENWENYMKNKKWQKN